MTTDDMTKELAYEYVVGLRAEIKRLRAVLEEIAGVAENNTVLIPEKVAEFARRALENKP